MSGEQEQTTNWQAAERLIMPDYYNIFESDKLSILNTTVPMEEIATPGALILSEENIEVTPFGSNLIPWDSNKLLNTELSMLKKDAGRENAKVFLDVENNENGDTLCVVCKEKAYHKCRSCLTVAYCSREHQKVHWKIHRPYCVQHEVIEDALNGSYVVANCNIKKGEAVLIEKPYFSIPYSSDEHFHLLKFHPISSENQTMPIGKYSLEDYNSNVCRLPPVCLGCALYLDVKDIVPCSRCGFPMCDLKCKQAESHRRFECSIFVDNGISYEECKRKVLLAPRIFGIIRGLIAKKNDPKGWDIILNDKSTEKIWAAKMKEDLKFRINAEYLLLILQNIFQFKEATYSDLSSVLRIIEMKGIYGCMYDEEKDRTRRLSNIYRVSSLIQHRCIGNVISVQIYPTSIHVVATKSIKKGERLYQNLDRRGDLLHSLQRQYFSLSLTNRPCECSLCSNSEADGYLSAITCLKCRRRGFENYVSSNNALDVTSAWQCNKCGALKTCAQVEKLLHDSMKEMDCNDPEEDSFELECRLRRGLIKYKGNVLHPNHTIILAAELNVVFLMMNRLDFLDREDIDYIIQLLSCRIRILNQLLPGMHSSLVSMKMRMAMLLAHQTCRTPLLRQENIMKIFSDLQRIYDDIAESFFENSKKNVIQAYLLVCLRRIRKIMADVGGVLSGSRNPYALTAVESSEDSVVERYKTE